MSQTCCVFRVLIRSKNICRTNKMHFHIIWCILVTIFSATCFGRYSCQIRLARHTEDAHHLHSAVELAILLPQPSPRKQ
jgi:hypothetical protein